MLFDIVKGELLRCELNSSFRWCEYCGDNLQTLELMHFCVPFPNQMGLWLSSVGISSPVGQSLIYSVNEYLTFSAGFVDGREKKRGCFVCVIA